MLKRSISLVLITQLYKIFCVYACAPNTYFILNGRLCYCNSQSLWSEKNCKDIGPNQHCQPGDVIWQGCKQCICQANGRLFCSTEFCRTEATKAIQSALSEYGAWCLPFRTYYVNCSLCLCSASGKSQEAQCISDSSCPKESYTIDISTLLRKQCMPNVIYLYPCIQCLCSENGLFVLDYCIQKCQPQNREVTKCKPGSLYRNDYKICKCPDSGIQDENLCFKSEYNKDSRISLNVLRSFSIKCVPGTFTKRKCLFCDCNSDGTINTNSCLELNCTAASKLKDTSLTDNSSRCVRGELVPICMECFCLTSGNINETYCTNSCTYESKIRILEKIFRKKAIDPNVINKTLIRNLNNNDPCTSNTMYLKDGRYCLCSGDGKEDYCTTVIKHSTIKTEFLENSIKYNLSSSCAPNTLVEIDCNTCYCTKYGKIDPKWCTYDDCEAKRLVQESHKSKNFEGSVDESTGVCTPGAISKVKCNFCICPESGILKERACTKNSCYDYIDVIDSRFTCEPLAYYEVDCNICYCPHDGLKNVDKCTKNSCEKSFLRSDGCVPGHLFSDECNVCVCPPSGDKTDKICTNHTCGNATWNIFKMPESLSDNKVKDSSNRSLDQCFPGEEFSVGCDLCICTDLGLKTYANCEPILCNDDINNRNRNTSLSSDGKRIEDVKLTHFSEPNHLRVPREVRDDCFVYNISDSSERKECTPGTMYIIRCRQCICPYVGNINNFCRLLPNNFYCEQAFPGFNYLPMGRRHVNVSELKTTPEKLVTIKVRHTSHTIYKCNKSGNLEDECFKCDCNNGVFILEHCFKNDAEKCFEVLPSFGEIKAI